MLGWLKGILSSDLAAIAKALEHLVKEQKRMSAHLDALAAQVDASDAAAQAATDAITGLVAKVGTLAQNVADLTAQLSAATGAAEDPAVIDALAVKLKTASDALTAAVATVPAG